MSRIPGRRVIACATSLLGAGLMNVSFDAQYTFILAQNLRGRLGGHEPGRGRPRQLAIHDDVQPAG